MDANTINDFFSVSVLDAISTSEHPYFRMEKISGFPFIFLKTYSHVFLYGNFRFGTIPIRKYWQ